MIIKMIAAGSLKIQETLPKTRLFGLQHSGYFPSVVMKVIQSTQNYCLGGLNYGEELRKDARLKSDLDCNCSLYAW